MLPDTFYTLNWTLQNDKDPPGVRKDDTCSREDSYGICSVERREISEDGAFKLL